jgi:hypothetical protein
LHYFLGIADTYEKSHPAPGNTRQNTIALIMTSELVRKCAQALGQGADFPTIWHTVLKGHELVGGIPRQRFEGSRSLLEIPLVNGYCVVYEAETREFSLQVGSVAVSRGS